MPRKHACRPADGLQGFQLLNVCVLHTLQVVQVLKKEIMKTQSKDLEKAAEYRQLLVQAIHSCAVKFPDVAGADIITQTPKSIRQLMAQAIHCFIAEFANAGTLDAIFGRQTIP